MDFSIANYAAKRMVRYGLTLDHVRYIIKSSTETYRPQGAKVYKGSLPDGRIVKVRVKESEQIEIVDVILLQGNV